MYKKPTVLGPEQEVVYKIDLIAVFYILVSKSEDFIFNPCISVVYKVTV